MTKLKPNTKEQLVYFLLNHISLGTYDKKFLNNIQVSNLIYNKPLTTNQADLLDKITLRYSKQLGKMEISAIELISLPWTNKPIQSLPEYTEAFLTLVDSELILRSPYKKEFLQELNPSGLNGIWNREKKQWTFSYSSHVLKSLRVITETHFGKINYCDTLQSIINKIDEYKDYKYWNPTLVYVNGNQIVYGTNEHVHDAIKNIEFDFSLKTLSRLTQHGIKIDQSIIDEYLKNHDHKTIEFAIEDAVAIEINDMSVVELVKKLEVDHIIFGSAMQRVQTYFNELRLALGNKLKFYYLHDFILEKMPKDSYGIFFSGRFMPSGAQYPHPEHQVINGIYSKTLHVVNSQPIELK